MTQRPVVLDTSFLIACTNPARANHEIALSYFREAIRQSVPLFLSSIVVAEYERRQKISDLGLNNFMILPFNFDDGREAAVLAEALSPGSGAGARVCLAADIKIIAQAKRVGAVAMLTEDKTTMASYIDQLRGGGFVSFHAVLTEDGFDAARLSNPAAPGLPFR